MTSPGSPNYDLGTAHGRIKIDVDDKGAKAADRSLAEFAKTIRKMERQFASFNTSLNKIEREIKNLGRDFNKAEHDAKSFERATDGLDNSQIKAARSTSNWRTQIRSFSATLTPTADTIRRAAQHARDFGSAIQLAGSHVSRGRREVDILNVRLKNLIHQLEQAGNAANSFGPAIANAFTVWRRLGNANGLSGFIKSLRGLPVAGVGVSILAGKILGLNKAMKDIPQWQKRIVSVVSAFQGFALAAGLLGRAIDKLGMRDPFRVLTGSIRFLVGASLPLSKTTKQIEGMISAFRRLGSGSMQAIAGFALMRQGLNGLINRFGFIAKIKPVMFIAIGAAASVASAAIEVLGKGLIWTSNILKGLWSGIKQLSGGLLALPGLMATIFTSVGVLATAFSGLKSMFEDVFKNMDDPEKFAEAMAKIPPQFRNLANILVDTVKMLKGLREEITTTFSQGLDSDIEALSNQFMGPLRHGALTVAQAFVDTRSKLMDLLTSQQSINDFGLSFQYTAGTIRNLNKAIVPVGSGLRDIAIVGMEFIRNLSSGAESLTQKFAEWAKVNRENGNLMRWMENAVQGAKDLARGLWDLTKALWTILTMFSDRSGDNALDRFADSMKKFNDAVQKSAAVGFIKDFGDAVRNLGTDKITQLREIFKNLWGTIQDILPVIKEISSAFSDVFVPAIKIALKIIEQFFTALDNSGLSKYIGWILGLAASFKLLSSVIGPILNLGKVIVGLATGLGGLKRVLEGATLFMLNFGKTGEKVFNVFTKLGGALSRAAGTIGIVATAMYGLYELFSNSSKKVDEFNGTLKDSDKHLVDFKESLREAFNADNGISGNSVFNEVTTQMSTMLNDLETKAKKVPDIWDNITASFAIEQRSKSNSFWGQRNPFAQAQSFNDMQKLAQDAQRAKQKFDDLGLSTKDLASIVTSSDSAFKAYSESLRASGENGNEAAAALQSQRDAFVSIQKEYATASQGSVALVNAINEIGNAGDNTASKLSALNNALKALGFNKGDQYEAAFAFAEAIRKVGDEAANAVDKSQPLEGIFGPDGVLATSGPAAANAQNLYNVVRQAVDAFKDVAASGGDIDAAWGQLQNSLGNTAAAFQTDISNIQSLVTNLTGNDYIVKLLMTVTGEDKVKAQIAAILTQYAQGGPGAEIKIPLLPDVSSDQVQKAIDDAFGKGKGAVGNGFITISAANITPEAIANLQKQIPGLQVPGGPPAPAAPIQVTPEPKPGPKSAFQPPTETSTPEIAPSSTDQAALDKANQTISDLQKKIDELNSKEAKVNLDVKSLDDVKNKIEEITNLVKDKEINIKVGIDGFDDFSIKMQQISAALSKSVLDWNGYQNAVGTVIRNILTGIDTFVSSAVAKFTALNSGQYDRGVAFVADFARGIDDNISLGIDAATRLAQAVRDRMPGSPAKKGPLAGSGWSGVAGQHFSEDFAGGIRKAAPAAVGAAEGVAGGVGNAVQGPYDIGKFLGRLQQLVGFGEHLVDVIGKAADTVFSALKFMSDPMNKGTFFGQHPGFRRDYNISDKDLQRKREDALQQKLSSAVESGSNQGIRAGIEDLPGMAGLQGITNPIAEEIATAVIGEGIKRGDDREKIIKGLPAEMAKFGETLNADAGSIYDEIWSSLQQSSTGRSLPAMGYTSDSDLLNNVPIGKYSQSGSADLTQGLADCSSAVEDLVNIMDGRATGGRQMSTANAAQWFLDHGFLQGAGGLGDFRVAFNSGHMQATLPGGTPFNWGSDAAASRRGIGGLGADDPALTSRFFRPTDISGNGRLPGPDLSQLTPDELEQLNTTSGLSLKTQDQMLNELRSNNSSLDEAIRIGQDPKSSDQQVISSLGEIQKAIDSSSMDDTATGRSLTQALESQKSGIMDARGISENGNPIDTASSIASGATSIAKDIFGVINSSLDAIGGAKNITDTLVRGIENSEDIYNMVDEVQKFIDLAARIAGAVSSISGTVGGLVSAAAGADPSGGASGAAAALQGVSAISGVISGALDTVNGIIDLAQEAYRIFGTYFGEFLSTVAGAGSKLEGDVRFLLDENDRTLKAYSRDNPLDKRLHDLPFMYKDQVGAQPADRIGEVNIFPERGSDPAQITREMMFAVRVASMGAGNMI